MAMAPWWSAATSRTLRTLHLLAAAREESGRRVSEIARTIEVLTEQQDLLEQLLDEQAALHRIATLVARGRAPEEILGRAAEEIARISHVDSGFVIRFEPDATMTVVAGSGAGAVPSVAERVRRTGRPARIEADARAPLSVGAGAPIVIGDRLWGVAAAVGRKGLPPDADDRLAHLADMIATAISSTDARAQLVASRARVVAAADDARRRLERDLHDGIVHKLVSVALVLRSATTAVPPTLPELQAQLSDLETSVAAVIDEFREMTRGIHPAILSEGGLHPALKVLARRSAVPVELDVRVGRRIPERVEVAAYHLVSEALANAEHANASVVRVGVALSDRFLRLSVDDDGAGADLGRSSALISLEDRVGALGGEITVSGPPDPGTSLRVTLPVELP
jgi:signal transduction histidine kinase